MYIAGSLVGSDKSYTATPLRSYPPDERAAHAYELGPFDEEARRYQARSYYDEMTTATLARAFIEKHCFQPLEPEVIDSVLPLLQQQSNRAVAKAS